MSETFEEGGIFSLQELPMIFQEGRLKAAIIGIDQLKSLLTRLKGLESQLGYESKSFLGTIDGPGQAQGQAKKENFISWKEEDFKSLSQVGNQGQGRLIPDG